MIRFALSVLVALVLVGPVQAQEVHPEGPQFVTPTFDLAELHIGPAIPFPIEIDGNPRTTEWMVYALNTDFYYLINPAKPNRPLGQKVCQEVLWPTYPSHPQNYSWQWWFDVRLVNGRSHLFVIDVDDSDGVAPFVAQPIRFHRCK